MTRHTHGGVYRRGGFTTYLRYKTRAATWYKVLRMCILFTVGFVFPPVSSCRGEISHWVTAYCAGWQIGNGNDGYLPVSLIDFSAFTHVIHFALVPEKNGGLDSVSNSITPGGAAALTGRAHPAGAKVLICVGGAGTESAFEGATDSVNLGRFVDNIVAFVKVHGYDGVDIDWEPINPVDYSSFTSLAAGLRSALTKTSPGLILTTTCVDGNQDIMSKVQNYFDQINIMTYDMSFPSEGWVVWFNSPVYSDGVKFPGIDEYVPSIDGDVNDFEAAGVAPGKIGIGAEFGGTVWEGVTSPGELLSTLTSIRYDVPLYSADGSGIMQKYFNPQDYHWDQGAEAGYLSISKLAGLVEEFVSYDDQNSLNAKAAYIKKKNIGGIIIYELGMGYPGKNSYPLVSDTKSDFRAFLMRPAVPSDITLDQNYPNPFNPSTTITYLARTQGRVIIKVYNVLGELVRTLYDGQTTPGVHVLRWDAGKYPSGLYILSLQTGGVVFSRKMLLLK